MANRTYQAHEQFKWRTDPSTGARYEVISKTSTVHAYEVFSPSGDPWKTAAGKPLSHTDPHFFDGWGPRAACGMRVKVALYALFKPEDAGACKRCAEKLGKPVRRSGPPLRERQPEYLTVCSATLERYVGSDTFQHVCVLLAGHGGKPHRDNLGSTWELGVEDFVPWLLQPPT